MAKIINLSSARKRLTEADERRGAWLARRIEMLRMGCKLKDAN